MNEKVTRQSSLVLPFLEQNPDVYMKWVLEESWLEKILMTCSAWNFWSLLWTCRFNDIIAFCIQRYS